jgi:hypothetical protein
LDKLCRTKTDRPEGLPGGLSSCKYLQAPELELRSELSKLGPLSKKGRLKMNFPKGKFKPQAASKTAIHSYSQVLFTPEKLRFQRLSPTAI